MALSQTRLATRQPERPLMRFPTLETFIERHTEATIAEFHGELQRIKTFNDRRWKFKAAVVTGPSDDRPYQSHVLRVDLNQPGSVIQRFNQGKLRFVDGNRSSDWCTCRRGEDVVPLNKTWAKYTEIIVYVEPADAAAFKSYLTPHLRGKAINQENLSSNTGIRWIEVEFRLEASKVTVDAELQALQWLVKGISSQAGSDVFSYLMEFKNPKRKVDFFELYTQVNSPDEIPDIAVRHAMKNAINGFDQDQRKAYESLRSLNEGICFIPGGPGAGKTRWALTIALLAQAGVAACKVLYLVDINSAVDDSADRMQALYDNAGLKKTVIRVSSWGGVDKDFLDQNDRSSGIPRGLMAADFTEGFLGAEKCPRREGEAPTLHQRVWEFFNSSAYMTSQSVYFNKITLAKWNVTHNVPAEGGQQKNHEADLEELRKLLVPLYYTVIRDADFIATTPIAARRIMKIFQPDIVIFDECGHARELTTMTSLAFFKPKVFFFVGDHRQTEPYTEETGHRYAPQLKISTMERADANGAAQYQLLVNHRAHGGLERLASGLFYKGYMRSDKLGRDDLLFPNSVLFLRDWLQSLPERLSASGHKTKVSGNPNKVPRLIIDHWGNTHRQAKDGTSSYSKAHEEIVMEQVKALVNDCRFTQVNSETEGTIMIISPYKAAVQNYLKAVQTSRINKRNRRRITVRTIDTAQGQEADLVILDLVKDHSTAHTDNAKRLCVSLTRARQAEIIMMSGDMAAGGINNNIRKIWGLCKSGEAGAILHIVKPEANYTW